MEDPQIIELYWQRSEAAIAETDEKYGAYCRSIAHSILRSRQDAEESVNDTWLAAWNSMPPHRPNILSAFLGKITRRLSIDRFRSLTAEKRGGGQLPLALEELSDCVPAGSDPAEAAELEALTAAINTFLTTLPATERHVFLCRYWYLHTIPAIGERFGFSESKVKSMLHRTRSKLRDYLGKEGF